MSQSIKNYDVVILGGGILGMAAAYELSKHNYKVCLIEKQADLGGAISSYNINGFSIEAFYHHFFPSDKYLIKLLGDLDLSGRIMWCAGKTGFLLDKKVYALHGFKDIFNFKPLSGIDKLMFCFFMAYVKFLYNPERLDDVSAEHWITSHFTKSLYADFFETLLKSKFGDQRAEISAAFIL